MSDKQYGGLFESDKYNNVLVAKWLHLPRADALALIAPHRNTEPELWEQQRQLGLLQEKTATANLSSLSTAAVVAASIVPPAHA